MQQQQAQNLPKPVPRTQKEEEEEEEERVFLDNRLKDDWRQVLHRTEVIISDALDEKQNIIDQPLINTKKFRNLIDSMKKSESIVSEQADQKMQPICSKCHMIAEYNHQLKQGFCYVCWRHDTVCLSNFRIFPTL